MLCTPAEGGARPLDSMVGALMKVLRWEEVLLWWLCGIIYWTFWMILELGFKDKLFEIFLE